MFFVNALGGLALFLFGMKLMSSGLQQAAGEKMRNILRFFSSNRFVGIFSGTVVTSVVQSSSVTTVMVIGFINAGLLTLPQSIEIIFGANIGTTVTAQLAALTANRVARQAALAHTQFNVIGVLLIVVSFFIPWGDEPAFFHLVRKISGNGSLQWQIANAHTFFNIATTVLLIPFMSVLAKICEYLIPLKEDTVSPLPRSAGQGKSVKAGIRLSATRCFNKAGQPFPGFLP